MLCLGASAGLPIMLVYQVLSIWLRESDISRSTIGFLVWVGFAYSLKFLWAPLVDRTRIPGFSDLLGNRRGWTLFAILGTALAMWSMSVQDPTQDLAGVVVSAVLIAFASATLDICVDAWRVDSGLNAEQASLSAIYQLGYRFGMIAAVSGGLFVAEKAGFGTAYLLLGLLAAAGASTPLWAPQTATELAAEAHLKEPNPIIAVAKGLATLGAVASFIWFGMQEGGYLRLAGAYVGNGFDALLSPLSEEDRRILGAILLVFILSLPFLGTLYFLTKGRASLSAEATYAVPILGDLADVVRRLGWMALIAFAIVATYRISDTTMGVMAGPLYVDLGYTKDVIGAIKGLWGITMLIVGAFLGGWWATRFGLANSMIAGAVITISTNLTFAWLSSQAVPADEPFLFNFEFGWFGLHLKLSTLKLAAVIGVDNIAAGFAGGVFIAFMSVITNKSFSASQYALFSSLYAFYGKTLAGFSGVLADQVGYESFFVATALFGVPALLFVIYTWLSGFTDNITETAERGDKDVAIAPPPAAPPTEAARG